MRYEAAEVYVGGGRALEEGAQIAVADDEPADGRHERSVCALRAAPPLRDDGRLESASIVKYIRGSESNCEQDSRGM